MNKKQCEEGMDTGDWNPRNASESIATRTAVVGTAGAVTGTVLGTFRNASALFYGVSMGVNFALVSGTYFGMLEGLSAARGIRSEDATREDCALVGLGTGSMLMTVFSGYKAGIRGGIAFAALGVLGHMGMESFEAWRQRKREELLSAQNHGTDNSK